MMMVIFWVHGNHMKFIVMVREFPMRVDMLMTGGSPTKLDSDWCHRLMRGAWLMKLINQGGKFRLVNSHQCHLSPITIGVLILGIHPPRR